MIKRYYYDCLIQASWMAKTFGMQFKSPRGQNLYWDGGGDFRAEKDCGIYGGEIYRISPESLPLLEPMMGDLVKRDGKIGYIGKSHDGTGELADFVIYNDTCKFPFVSSFLLKYYSDYKIIQRQGKPFFNPLCEEV